MTMTEPVARDTSPSIGPSPSPWTAHVVAGIYIGDMFDVRSGTYDTVLTVAAQPGRAADTVRHRHVALDYQDLNANDLHEGVNWVLEQVNGNRKILIRSERGLQRPGLVAGMTILRMGGWYADAVPLVQEAKRGALTDPRYLQVLRDEHELLYQRQVPQ